MYLLFGFVNVVDNQGVYAFNKNFGLNLCKDFFYTSLKTGNFLNTVFMKIVFVIDFFWPKYLTIFQFVRLKMSKKTVMKALLYSMVFTSISMILM